MHTTIGLALVMNPADFMNWPQGTLDTTTVYDASEPHRIVSFIPQSLFQYLWLVTMLEKNEKNICAFVGAPVWPSMLNMPKSVSDHQQNIAAEILHQKVWLVDMT